MAFVQQHGTKRTINRCELKILDNFLRKLKEEKDQDAFCRLFFAYFEGILSFTEFFKLYDERFNIKLKPEFQEEFERLL